MWGCFEIIYDTHHTLGVNFLLILLMLLCPWVSLHSGLALVANVPWMIPKYLKISRHSPTNSELKWTGMGEFSSDDHYIYYCGQESPLEEME